MNRFLSNRYLLFLSQTILGLVFIIASVEKITFPELFAANIQAYKLLPIELINLAALVLPWIELIAGIFLLSGLFARSNALLISFLLGFFIVSMVIALARGLTIDCGCFGSSQNSPVSWVRVAEDLLLMLLGGHIYFYIPDVTIAGNPFFFRE